MDNPMGPNDSINEMEINQSVDSIMDKLNAESNELADTNEEANEEETVESNSEEENTETEYDDATTQEETDTEPGEEEEEQPIYTVRVNGEEVEVTLEELQNGYSRQSDYTRKSQELAEKRRQLETQFSEIESNKQKYEQGLQQALHYANNFDPILAEARTIDWNKLAEENPAAYTRKKAAVEQRVAQVEHMQKEQNRLLQERNQQLVQKEVEMLQQKIPEWSDESVRKADLQKIVSGLREYGFNDQELAELMDHRAFLIARDAMRYREMQKAKKTVGTKKVTKPAPKMQRPGAQANADNKPNPNKALLKKAKQSGKTNDIVDAIVKNL